MFAITDKAVGHCFTHKSHTETLADRQTTTQPRSAINYLSFNSIDNLLQPNKEVGGRGFCMLVPQVLLQDRLGSFSPITQFPTECVSPWSEQRGTIQMGIK